MRSGLETPGSSRSSPSSAPWIGSSRCRLAKAATRARGWFNHRLLGPRKPKHLDECATPGHRRARRPPSRRWRRNSVAFAPGTTCQERAAKRCEESGAGVQLSAGQRQLPALARALVGMPAALLLDEATAAIDGAPEAAFRASLPRRRRVRDHDLTSTGSTIAASTVRSPTRPPTSRQRTPRLPTNRQSTPAIEPVT